MKEDKIKNIFSEQLKNYEAPVDSSLWSGVASSIGTTGAATSGLSLLTKVIIGITSATVISSAIYFMIPEDKTVIAVSKQDATVNQNKASSTIEKQKNPAIEKQVNLIEHQVDQPNEAVGVIKQKDQEPTLIEQDEIITPPKVDTNLDDILLTDNSESKEIIEVTQINNLEEEQDVDVTTSVQQEANNEEVEIEDSILENNTLNEEDKNNLIITNLPNVLTVNGDGINDELFIDFEGTFIDFQIVILNQQNAVIYQSKDPNFKWDGRTQNGNRVEAGTFYYIITGKSENNDPIREYSSLTITR